MRYDEFVRQVQHRAQLASSGEAVGAIRATLGTLSERLTVEETRHLTSQLPAEIAEYMAIMPEFHAQRFSLDAFFEIVAMRERADLLEAIHHARVVLEVLGEAVSAGEISDVCAQLPEEFRPLIEAGSPGQLKR